MEPLSTSIPIQRSFTRSQYPTAQIETNRPSRAGLKALRTLSPAVLPVMLLVLAALVLAAMPGCQPWTGDGERIDAWSRRGLLGGLRVTQRAPLSPPEGSHATVTIAATGDLKGWITNTMVYPRRRGAGLAHLAPVITELRAGDPGLVLLDAGDTIHGALSGILPIPSSKGSIKTNGKRAAPFPILKLMNALGYDGAALGNFDMSLGWRALGKAIGGSDFPWLSANLAREGGGTVLPPYRVLQRNGVRIGILAMTTPRVAAYLAPRHLESMAFIGMEETARRWVPVLREVEGVDLVVGLFHSGLNDDYDREPILRGKVRIGGGAGKIADTGLGFDLIVSGDAHRLSPRYPTAALGAYAVPVLETGSRGNALAVATIELSVQGGRWRVRRVTRRTLWAEKKPGPAAMALVSAEMKAVATHLNQPARARIRRVPRRGEFYRCAGALSHRAALSNSDLSTTAALSNGAAVEAPFSLLPMRWRFEKPVLKKLKSKPRKKRTVKKGAVKKRAGKNTLKKRKSRKRKPKKQALNKKNGKRKGGKKITGKRKRTQRKRTERRRRRTGRIQSRPLLRADLYRWMTYRETLVLASLTGRQITLLLEGYVRHLRKWVVRNSAVLWPGGLAVEVREKGSEIITLRRKSDGAEIHPRARYRVWLTDFIWNGGGGGLAPKALIAREQRITGLPSPNQQGGFSLRETVFAMLNDPDFQVPPECARWLENPPEKGANPTFNK